MAPKAAVAVERVSKRFTVYHRRPGGLKEQILAWIGGRRADQEDLWALQDVSFAVAPGEMFGLIGANGSGKSTLLQVIAGIYTPDTGAVTIDGRLRALLELGTGFNPELSGRENVFLNASLLGFSRADVRRRFDTIVEFAELERFIDMPLKTYSSGMQVRLGFATAIHLDPEVLLLDEVLAVGDDHFQRKCLRRVREIRESGAAIVFISHDLVSVEQLCDRVALLAAGRLVREGEPAAIISEYRSSLAESHATSAPTSTKRWGTGAVRIERVTVTGPRGATRAFRHNDSLTVSIEFTALAPVARPAFGLAIRRNDGTLVTGPNTKMCGFPIESVSGHGLLQYHVPRLPLLSGAYILAAAVYDDDLLVAFDHWEDCAEFIVLEDGTRERFGVVSLSAEWRLQAGGRQGAGAAATIESLNR